MNTGFRHQLVDGNNYVVLEKRFRNSFTKSAFRWAKAEAKARGYTEFVRTGRVGRGYYRKPDGQILKLV